MPDNDDIESFWTYRVRKLPRVETTNPKVTSQIKRDILSEVLRRIDGFDHLTHKDSVAQFVLEFRHNIPGGGCQYGGIRIPEQVLKRDGVLAEGARIWDCPVEEVELVGVGLAISVK